MDMLYVGLLIADIYLIVYYRLMIHYHQQAPGGTQRAGIALVASVPQRKGLSAADLKYWHRYWLAWAAMVVLVAIGLWWRYPHIVGQFRMLD